MLLRYSPTSPFARKVLLLVHELGLTDQVDLETVDGWAEPARLTADNPLSMVPTLTLDDGTGLYDSPVICDYLDRRYGGSRMLPVDGEVRWRVLRDQALADGVLDCAVLVFVECHRRPEPLRWDAWLALKRNAIQRSLARLEGDAAALAGRVDLGTLSLAAALGYLDLRGAVGAWRDGRPALADWYAGFAERPSMRATAPPI